MSLGSLIKIVCFTLTLAVIPWGVEQSQAAPTLNPFVNYSTSGNYAYSPPLRKFVDSLPGLGVGARTANTALGANNLGQGIPIATPGTLSGFPNDDYYEIALVEYHERLHSDLPAVTGTWPNQSGGTKLRGYVQLVQGTSNFVSPPHYLGPMIIATKNRPVRIKFVNMLPLTASGGNLFLPVDTTIMGAGMGPKFADGTNCDPATQACASYTENRATIHLHGGLPPWISDGTAHQWITPAGESTPYLKGASQQNVPDMPLPPNGSATFYWPNQQGGRLMFYHDHALGMTGLNVYAGEAAGYLLSDPAEETALINAGAGVVPGTYPTDLAHLIPLVIQDRTFVYDNSVSPVGVTKDPTRFTKATDPLWDLGNWGPGGNFWFPHVYMPNQDPTSLSGANPLGRWDYGPWFWPVFPVASPYPPTVSHVPEAFMDTPVVNGTPYPYLNVAAQPYRLRILNAANDRMFNLQLYQADPLTIAVTNGGSGYTVPPTVNISAPPPGGTQATATANMTGSLVGATITSGGLGYTSVPTVSISGLGTGAVGTATMTIGVTGVSNLVGGSGYTTAPAVTFSGGGTPSAQATATATISGSVNSITVNGGGSYNTAPTVTIAAPPAGTTATATATITGSVSGYTISNGGSGYTTAPTVNIAAPTGSGPVQAVATATVSNVVNAVIPTNGGSGYTSAPNVTFSGGGLGTDATATATITGSVSAIAVTNGGSGYATAPSVVLTGGSPSTPATATASITGVVNSVAITSGGSGYTAVPTVNFVGGTFTTPATATAILTNGVVTGINITSGGSGYTVAPTGVTFTGANTTPASGTATITNVVNAIAVTTPGVGYTSAPAITFAGGGGIGATASATVTGTITGITVTNGGSGYTSAPVVTITGDGTSATATATVLAGAVNGFTSIVSSSNFTTATVSLSAIGGTAPAATATVAGPVTSYTVTNGGSGYISAPAVVVTGSGLGASGTATITGVVNSIAITGGGSGYATPPTVTFTGGTPITPATAVATINGSGTITAITITNPGSGYSSAPTISFTGVVPTVAATATAKITNVVNAINVVTQGLNYTSAPTVTLVGGGGIGATATAAISASLSAINLTNPGSGYTSAPTVTISGGGGTLASAFATITGVVSSLTFTNPGAGYTSPPAISFTPVGSGSGAVATATITGPVTGITVVSGGSGYTSTPAVTFGSGTASATAVLASSVTGITINTAGVGYTSAPTLTIAAPTGANPVQATASATVGGVVSGVNFTSGGTGYTTGTTTISFTGGGASIQAVATPIVAGTVTGVTVTNPGVGYTSAPTVTFTPVGAGGGATAVATVHTEVKMVPATANPAIPFPATWQAGTPGMTPDILDSRISGVPDPTMRGPAMIQIGTEGGLLPGPVLLENIPVGFEQNKRNIVVLNVLEKTLFMAPAERADVIVDFTPYAGKTIILYNDSPAPVPAGDPRYDFYTGNPDYSATGGANNQGGAPSTLPGYGPNTRTIMQFRVAGTDSTPTVPGPVDYYNPATLTALQNPTTGLPAIFKATQDAPVVPESAYNAIGYTGGATTDTLARIQDLSLTFTPYGSTTPITKAMKNPTIQELFDPQGRMNATLGVELPFTGALIQTTVPLGFKDPTTETIAPNEAQLWKITHNGVDTHGVHFHLVNVQVVNRVGWDGAIRPTDPNELGWKETVRMNPLEDIIVAMRAKVPTVPFAVPDSVRPLDPTMPVGSTFASLDPITGAPVTVTNATTNFGREYTWHCHILGHEENDMMRPFVLLKPHNDFNYDGKTDILWQKSDGSIMIWNMNGLSYVSTTTLPSEPDTSWKIVAAADFNHDGKPDILWRNTSTGDNRIWLMSSESVVGSTVALPAETDQNWEIAATGDLNNDHYADIIWQNTSNGQTRVWLMNDTTFVSSVALPTVTNLGNRIAGTGDFNGDGKTDILLRNQSTVSTFIWVMNGTTRVGNYNLPLNSNTNVHLFGTGDFNQDGNVDLLWRNMSTGVTFVWLMNGVNRIGNANLQSAPVIAGNSGWNIVGR